MKIETIAHLPPLLIQEFDRDLLMNFLQRSYKRIMKLSKLSLKKIRPQDIGKRRDFEKLSKLYLEEYERKKIEEEKYQEETRKLAEKVPRISNSGGTRRFTRMDARK